MLMFKFLLMSSWGVAPQFINLYTKPFLIKLKLIINDLYLLKNIKDKYFKILYTTLDLPYIKVEE